MRGRAGLTRLALLAGAALALTGCQTSEQLATSSAVTAIGFEGFIGVPQPVGVEVARELVRATDGRRFTLVPASDASARYLMRGYLAPASEGSAVTYVWDLFDRSGQRMQRLSGEVRLPPGDPWAALSNGAARPLALSSVGAIDAFLQRPAPVARQTAPTPAEPQGATAAASPAGRPAAGRRVVVEAVVGLEPAQAGVLAAAMRRALGDLGYAVQAPGASADVVLSAEVTLNPPAREGRFVTVAWQVADGAGRTLGEIRQMARLPEAALARDGASAFARAVEAVLPGLVALAPPR